MKSRVLILTFCICITFGSKSNYSRLSSSEKGSIEIKNPTYLAPILRTILKFLGQTYLGYKMGDVFEYLEDNLSNFYKSHIESVWSKYENYSNKQAFTTHYKECPVCHSVGETISNEALLKRFDLLEKKVEDINKLSVSRIVAIERKFDLEIKRINNELNRLDERVNSNTSRIEVLENIHGRSIILLKAPSRTYLRQDNYGLNKLIQKYNPQNQIVSDGISPVIYYNSNNILDVAQEFSEVLNLKVEKYDGSGINGLEKFDLIIIY